MLCRWRVSCDSQKPRIGRRRVLPDCGADVAVLPLLVVSLPLLRQQPIARLEVPTGLPDLRASPPNHQDSKNTSLREELLEVVKGLFGECMM